LKIELKSTTGVIHEQNMSVKDRLNGNEYTGI